MMIQLPPSLQFFNSYTKDRMTFLVIKFGIRWYDAWIGFYYDQEKQTLYFCPLPFCVFVVYFI